MLRRLSSKETAELKYQILDSRLYQNDNDKMLKMSCERFLSRVYAVTDLTFAQ